MQIIGVISASLVMGFVIVLLHDAYTIGDGLSSTSKPNENGFYRYFF